MSEADITDDETDLQTEAEADADGTEEQDQDQPAPLLDEIRLVAPDEVIPYGNNPKEHPEWQIDKLASSIKNYGFDQPIVVDEGNEIIKGHGRLQAAKKLGLTEVPVIRREDLSTAQAKASRIADNKTHMDTGWDLENLALEFEEIEAEDYDMDATGFDPEEVDAIMENADFDIDEFFEEEEEPEEMDGEDDGGPPPGEVACPECGHTFAPSIDDMGERETDDSSDDEPELDDAAEPIDTAR